MKNVLFIADISLKNPIRGTPLRIYNFLLQIKKKHKIYACVKDIKEEDKINFIPFPRLGGFKKLFYFARAAKSNKIDIVITATETSIKLPVFLKFFCGTKIAIDIHGLYAEELYYKGSIGRFKKFVYDKIVKFYLYFYDLLIVCADKLKDYYYPVNSNIKILYGGVNLNEFEAASVKKTDIFTIGYMGNARQYQGLDYLLQAAANIKRKNTFPFRLNLVLSDEDELVMKNKLKELGILENALLNFNVEHNKVNGIINASDVLVIPRPSVMMTEYAFPSKLPEYLATGIPIVITDVGPVKTFPKIREACIVSASKNIPEHLEEALHKVYSMSDEEKNVLREKALFLVKSEFNWDVLGNRLNELLEKL